MRSILAILTLYAFLLQGLLGVSSADVVGVGAAAPGALAFCTTHVGASGPNDPGRNPPDNRCCALDCLVPVALAPPAPAAPPARVATKIETAPIRRDAALATRVAPPSRARGPPILV